jgi:hypothetical protein
MLQTWQAHKHISEVNILIEHQPTTVELWEKISNKQLFSDVQNPENRTFTNPWLSSTCVVFDIGWITSDDPRKF